jgi:hypothetical protein
MDADVAGVITPVQVESEILRMCALIERATEEVAKRARSAAKADTLYRRRYAQALLVAEGRTIPERQAMAVLDCTEELDAHKWADALLLSAQEAGRSYRAILDALRSINANVRASSELP